ncbi:MAG: hypothetical protein AAF420_14695 [Pseudomonadota bacterium]
MGLQFAEVPRDQTIPGTFWGDPEAGLIGDKLYFRSDTPVHSVLHEACHYLCMAETRRDHLHTSAGGDHAEEEAVCYLQVVLARKTGIPGYEQILRDMDAWGYSFRLGSARAWFENDAEQAGDWLRTRGFSLD